MVEEENVSVNAPVVGLVYEISDESEDEREIASELSVIAHLAEKVVVFPVKL